MAAHSPVFRPSNETPILVRRSYKLVFDSIVAAMRLTSPDSVGYAVRYALLAAEYGTDKNLFLCYDVLRAIPKTDLALRELDVVVKSPIPTFATKLERKRVAK